MTTVAMVGVGLLMLQAVGCASRKATVVGAAPADAIEPIPSGESGSLPSFDLNGAWATGSDNEPVSKSVTLQTPCLYHPAAWILQQTRNEIEAFSFPESHDQGVAQREPRRLPPSVRGKISGFRVTMDDPTSHYRLRYDPGTEHLRGTLNGKPFWAVRQIVVDPGGCLPPP